MRVDLRRGKEQNLPMCHDHNAYLDGVKLQDCVMADDEEGVAIVLVDWDGSVPPNEVVFGNMMQQVLRGKVEFRKV